jgi:hypothetical protein
MGLFISGNGLCDTSTETRFAELRLARIESSFQQSDFQSMELVIL